VFRGLTYGTRLDRIAAAILGAVFGALLGLLARKLWLAVLSHTHDLPRGRAVAVACLFTLASAACLCISGLALWRIVRRPTGIQEPQASASTVIPSDFLERPFAQGLAIQAILLFMASMVLDCGAFFSTCLSAFAIWDVVLVLLRRRVLRAEGNLYPIVAMLVPVLLFVLAWQFPPF
jgi:hypothetical protein